MTHRHADVSMRGRARLLPWGVLFVVTLALLSGAALAQEWKVLQRFEFGPEQDWYVLTHGETTTYEGQPVIAGTGSDRWARVDFILNVPVEIVHREMRLRYEYRIDTEGARILRGTHHPRTVSDKVGIVTPTEVTIGEWMIEDMPLVGMDVADHSVNKEPIAVGDLITSIRFQSRADNNNTVPHTIILRAIEFVVPAE